MKKIEKINHFTQKLENSGYEYKQCKEIVISTLIGLKRKEERRREQKRKCLSAQDTIVRRNIEKLTEKN